MWDSCSLEASRHTASAKVQGCTLCTGVITGPRLIQPRGFAWPGIIMVVEEKPAARPWSRGHGWLACLQPRSAASHRANTTRAPQLPSPTERGYSGSWNKREYPLATQIPLQLFLKVFQLGKGYAVCAPAAVSPKCGKNFWVSPVNSLPGRAISHERNP